MDWLQDSFGFAGRITRKQFWLSFAKMWGLGLVLGLVVAVFDTYPIAHKALQIAASILVLAYFASAIIRRLHDHNVSGWWLAGCFAVFLIDGYQLRFAFGTLPLPVKILSIALHVVTICLVLAGFGQLGLAPGTKGSNRFGPDRLNPESNSH